MLAELCYQSAKDNGWMEHPRSTLETDMLIVTEVAELSEAHRELVMPMSDHIEGFTLEEEEYADIIIRVANHSKENGVTPERLGQAVVAKMVYNLTRPYRHGGKKA
jgi:hypothetical protein